MLARILVGLFIAVIGFLMVWKTNWFLGFVGSIGFAEKYFSAEGGSRAILKIIGVVIVFIGFAIMTNLVQGMISSVVGPLFGAFNPA